MSSLRATWQNGPYKNKHTEQKKTRKHQDATLRIKKLIKSYFIVAFSAWKSLTKNMCILFYKVIDDNQRRTIELFYRFFVWVYSIID